MCNASMASRPESGSHSRLLNNSESCFAYFPSFPGDHFRTVIPSPPPISNKARAESRSSTT